MKFKHAVVYAGKFYRAGAEVPIKTKTVKTKTKAKKATVETTETAENNENVSDAQ